ncbi:hypothetical protein FGM00_18245 [Aggregatimonas sangjinii]|uniref:Arsenate reductase n=1 Tax=Aggregatimonas sangjinii TaxID=2583587 RepID=A0A5B7SYW4_9FLAO|nr:hypothetical protein [Aggregatimonas sangjinii]QCX01960.1 hypothetical protein FGM00_18245 [Aggregatimonas sangjinii]
MGVIAKHENKITLYYHSDTAIGKQTKAYLASSEKDILPIDLAQQNLTGTQWAEIAKGLGKSASDLIDKEHPTFVDEYGDDRIEMDEHQWLKILDNRPEVIICPILIVGEAFYEISTPSDIMAHIEADSAGLNERGK